MPKYNKKDYEIHFRELQQNFDKTKMSLTVHVDKRLHKQWKTARQYSPKSKLSSIVNHALLFALNGPHPFNDPLDGLLDAFEVYERRKFDEQKAAADLIEYLAKRYGLKIKIEGV